MFWYSFPGFSQCKILYLSKSNGKIRIKWARCLDTFAAVPLKLWTVLPWLKDQIVTMNVVKCDQTLCVFAFLDDLNVACPTEESLHDFIGGHLCNLCPVCCGSVLRCQGTQRWAWTIEWPNKRCIHYVIMKECMCVCNSACLQWPNDPIYCLVVFRTCTGQPWSTCKAQEESPIFLI